MKIAKLQLKLFLSQFELIAHFVHHLTAIFRREAVALARNAHAVEKGLSLLQVTEECLPRILH